MSHLQKACQLLQIDTSWRGDGVKAVTKGLANIPSTKARFPNSITPEWLDRVIRSESWESEFARSAYVAFLFTIRLPSEALPLHRALGDEKLLSSEPPIHTAVIGLRDLEGQPRLVLKLARRKNGRMGFAALRPCFCRENALVPKHNCPIHIFWADVLRTTQPGAPLSPKMKNRGLNRDLRSSFDRVNIPESEHYSTLLSPRCGQRYTSFGGNASGNP